MTEEETPKKKKAPKRKKDTGFFYKHGKFSKTSVGLTVTNAIAMVWFALSIAAGSEVDLGFWSFTIQPMNAGLCAAMLSIVNGTYVSNNYIKGKGSPE